jgi:hypothetical protein
MITAARATRRYVASCALRPRDVGTTAAAPIDTARTPCVPTLPAARAGILAAGTLPLGGAR